MRERARERAREGERETEREGGREREEKQRVERERTDMARNVYNLFKIIPLLLRTGWGPCFYDGIAVLGL